MTNRRREVDRILASVRGTDRVDGPRSDTDAHNERISTMGLMSLFQMETVE